MKRRIIKIELSGNRRLIGIGQNISVVAVGQQCDGAWGGGSIASLELEPLGVVARKTLGGSFEHSSGTGTSHVKFHEMLIPWHVIEYVAIEHVEDAKPAAEVDSKEGKPEDQTKGASSKK
jgi:hypothetical protein